MTDLKIIQGDCRQELVDIPDGSVHCCVTSPPYFGLRDYGVDGQIGLEPTPDEFVTQLVEVFREVRRVLRDDGTLWLNLGDSYANDGKWGGHTGGKHANGLHGEPVGRGKRETGLKPKDLIGIPWRVAFALRADGWYLRQDIIWAKPNPMPESVTDRCTKAHEYIFLLSKSDRYYYEQEAIKETAVGPAGGNIKPNKSFEHDPVKHRTKAGLALAQQKARENGGFERRNRRSVWSIASRPYSDVHFATYPPALIKPCILAGTSSAGCCAKCGAPLIRMLEKEKGEPSNFNGSSFNKGKTAAAREHLAAVGQQERTTATKTIGWRPTCQCEAGPPVPCVVLDPFAGSGTTGKVALELGRSAILIELNPDYVKLIEKRCRVNLPLNFGGEVAA